MESFSFPWWNRYFRRNATDRACLVGCPTLHSLALICVSVPKPLHLSWFLWLYSKSWNQARQALQHSIFIHNARAILGVLYLRVSARIVVNFQAHTPRVLLRLHDVCKSIRWWRTSQHYRVSHACTVSPFIKSTFIFLSDVLWCWVCRSLTILLNLCLITSSFSNECYYKLVTSI